MFEIRETNPTKPTELSITLGENKNLLEDNLRNSGFDALRNANNKNLKLLDKKDKERDLIGKTLS